MAIKGIFDKLKTGDSEEDFVELEHNIEEASPGKLLIQIEKLGNIADTERLQMKVREGHILLVKVKDLKEKDPSELKRSVEKVKRTITAIGGDIAGIGDDWIVVTPTTVKIHREGPSQ
jgi:SepF-like predicted cell division protein (DUF552 family)